MQIAQVSLPYNLGEGRNINIVLGQAWHAHCYRPLPVAQLPHFKFQDHDLTV